MAKDKKSSGKNTKKKPAKQQKQVQKKSVVVREKTTTTSKPKIRISDDENMRGIVRISGKDVEGHVPIRKAMYAVKGVGRRYASICAEIAHEKLGIDPDSQVGLLTDDQLNKLEEIIITPKQHNIPEYLLNRRKDYATGENTHLITNELGFAIKTDVEKEMKTKSWRGISHMFRKKVRGQRTKSTGRKGTTMGVSRKKSQPQKKK
jgi:small subunit ribosomal protein S13